MALTAVRSKAVVLLLLIRCWMLLPLWDSVIVQCFVVRYFVSILVLQSSRWGSESWLHCLFVFLVSRDCCVALPHDAYGFCFCFAFVCVCLLMLCSHLLGKGWPHCSPLWCLIVKLSLSHGSGVVLNCIDSWSLPSFLICLQFMIVTLPDHTHLLFLIKLGL